MHFNGTAAETENIADDIQNKKKNKLWAKVYFIIGHRKNKTTYENKIFGLESMRKMLHHTHARTHAQN